jgi:AraC-like DNA-binding protein
MHQQAVNQACEKNSMDGALAALSKSIARWTETGTQLMTAIPGLCVIAQGVKRVLLGDDTYVLDVHHFLITSVDLPTVMQIIHASRAQQSSRGMATGAVTVPLLSACQRLLDLLAAPQDMPILAPLIQREMLYRLLVGEQGARLRQIASAGSQSHQIAQAIEWLKRHYTLPLRIEDLAAHVHMSPSTFHQHFRALTAMSPLQYQKWLRLNEARRVMLTERLEAATAAFQVGYESPSQFSREYRRVFGAPPLRDITSLRQMAGSASV